jgi:hypothetical protein
MHYLPQMFYWSMVAAPNSQPLLHNQQLKALLVLLVPGDQPR